MRKVISFSADDQKDKDIIRHLKKQKNASAYIVDLIRADINNTKKNFSNAQRQEIVNIIEQFISENNISLETRTKKSIDPEIKNALDQFDNL